MLTADGRPPGLDWSYDRAELIADGAVHAIGLALAVAGLLPLLSAAGRLINPIEYASVLVYCVGLFTMLGCSTIYNLWPVNPRKWLLRRCDQSGIYVLIAATYTPFVAHEKLAAFLGAFPIALWAAALVAVAIKLTAPGWLDRLSVFPYFIIGLIGVPIYAPAWDRLSTVAISLIATGCLLYSTGVIFYLWRRLRFQNVVWHGFVVTAAACHYLAVLDCITQTAV